MKYFYLTGLLFFVLGSVVFFVYRGRKIKYDFLLRRHLQKIFHSKNFLLLFSFKHAIIILSVYF